MIIAKRSDSYRNYRLYKCPHIVKKLIKFKNELKNQQKIIAYERAFLFVERRYNTK